MNWLVGRSFIQSDQHLLVSIVATQLPKLEIWLRLRGWYKTQFLTCSFSSLLARIWLENLNCYRLKSVSLSKNRKEKKKKKKKSKRRSQTRYPLIMMETTSAHPPPTRYKTLRRSKLLPSSTNASATTLPSVAITLPSQQQTTGDGLSRSRSRYRRRPIVDTSSVPVPIPQIPVDLQRDHQQVVSPPKPSLLSPQKGLQKARPPQPAPSNPTSSEKRKPHPPSPVPPTTPAAGAANGAFLGQSERVRPIHPNFFE